MNGRKQRGASVVEFAIVAPLLFVILFGIIEFSLALFNQAMITNASREGARAGILWNNGVAVGDDQIEAIVNNAVAANLISLGGASAPDTTIVRAGSDPGSTVTVQVDYDYQFLVMQPLVALLGGALPGAINLRGTTAMRLE